MKEGVKNFNPVYLFDEGSTISWIPCGRKLTCSYPGIKFTYGPDTYFGNEVQAAFFLYLPKLDHTNQSTLSPCGQHSIPHSRRCSFYPDLNELKLPRYIWLAFMVSQQYKHRNKLNLGQINRVYQMVIQSTCLDSTRGTQLEGHQLLITSQARKLSFVCEDSS